MSDTHPAASVAAGSQSLRDTAKWLVGGVVATAAGVFAGSSLTALGTLDPVADMIRLGLAAGGLLAGFIALGVILYLAVRVLTRESMTFHEMATSDDLETRKVLKKLLERYGQTLSNAQSFTKLLQDVTELNNKIDKTSQDFAILKKSEEKMSIILTDGGFLFVKNRFNKLLISLFCMTPVAILGFGLFAWAANPGKPKTVSPAFLLTIQGPAHYQSDGERVSVSVMAR